MLQATRIAAVAIVAAVLGASLSPAAEDIKAALPRDYVGEFRWAGGTLPQKVEIRINLIERIGPTRIEAIGCGRYDVQSRITDIGVQLLIDTESLAVEIREFSPSGPGARTFVTDGSHKGHLSRDLKTIEAEWVSASDGRRGRLDLATGPRSTCPAAVAQAVPRAGRPELTSP
jgi:hypothetical protein